MDTNLLSRSFGLPPAVLDVARGVTQVQTLLVNLFLVELEAGRWVLVDAGLPGFAGRVKHEARQRFGDTPPRAIVLTHGHFDHVGSLKTLLETWDVPVYAHEMEMPYLLGRSKYPPPDPTVGGGLMARSAKLFPRGPIDLGGRVRALSADGSIAEMPGWRWVATPGHTPGHVSLFREQDRTLIAGDAFVTQKQESLVGVLTNHYVMHGPPTYFTPDWPSAAQSVKTLAALKPRVAATGHGLPARGTVLRDQLNELAVQFWDKAVPADGRYVRSPARADRTGVTYVPPGRFDPAPYLVAAGLGLAAAVWWGATREKRR